MQLLVATASSIGTSQTTVLTFLHRSHTRGLAALAQVASKRRLHTLYGPATAAKL